MPVTKVSVKLVGEDGNAFSILGRVISAMKKGKIENSIIEAYKKEAMSGDYNHLLATTMEYVNIFF